MGGRVPVASSGRRSTARAAPPATVVRPRRAMGVERTPVCTGSAMPGAASLHTWRHPCAPSGLEEGESTVTGSRGREDRIDAE